MWGFYKAYKHSLKQLTLRNGNFKSNKFFFSVFLSLNWSFLHYKTGLAKVDFHSDGWLCEIPLCFIFISVFIWHLKHLCFVDRYWTPVIVLPELIRQLEHVYHAYQFLFSQIAQNQFHRRKTRVKCLLNCAYRIL